MNKNKCKKSYLDENKKNIYMLLKILVGHKILFFIGWGGRAPPGPPLASGLVPMVSDTFRVKPFLPMVSDNFRVKPRGFQWFRTLLGSNLEVSNGFGHF